MSRGHSGNHGGHKAPGDRGMFTGGGCAYAVTGMVLVLLVLLPVLFAAGIIG